MVVSAPGDGVIRRDSPPGRETNGRKPTTYGTRSAPVSDPANGAQQLRKRGDVLEVVARTADLELLAPKWAPQRGDRRHSSCVAGGHVVDGVADEHGFVGGIAETR